MADDPKKILIIKPSALGDLIQVLPTLGAIRSTFPQATIKWMVRTEFAPLIENLLNLDDVILFDREFLGKAWKSPKAFKALLDLIKRLRNEKFDMVLDLQGLFRTASLGWLSGAKVRLGPANAREFGWIFYSKKIKQDQSCIHLVDYYLKIAEAGGIKAFDRDFELAENKEAAEAVDKLLDESGVDELDYAVLIPGSAHADKCWPVDNFAALADKIKEKYGYTIVAAGVESESILAQQINDKTQTDVINLAGKTNIPMLVELLRNASLVISNDTGPGHIAAAMGNPLVMIFGRSNPARVMPYNRPQCVAAIEPNDRGFKADSTNPKHTVNTITVDEVFEKVCEQLPCDS